MSQQLEELRSQVQAAKTLDMTQIVVALKAAMKDENASDDAALEASVERVLAQHAQGFDVVKPTEASEPQA